MSEYKRKTRTRITCSDINHGLDCDCKWIDEQLDQLPSQLSKTITARYKYERENNGRQAANLLLVKLIEINRERKIPAFKWNDFEEIVDENTGLIKRIKIKHERDLSNFVKQISHLEDDDAVDMALNVANTKYLWRNISARALERLEPRLRRYFRRESRRAGEIIALHAGAIGKNRNHVCSTMTLNRRNKQKEKIANWAERTTINLDNNETIQMRQAIENTRKKRLAEIYTKLKGLEKFARKQALTPCFITITAPPEMHPAPAIGANSWNGLTPDQSARWLMNEWAKLRARLNKIDITISGLRVTEPHKDGCPHGHILIFVPFDQKTEIEREIRKTWTTEAAAKIVWLDETDRENKASAASYVMKYALKTMAQTDSKEDREDAWRSTWSIRSIQFFGLPSSELWNAMRAASANNVDYQAALAIYYAKNGDYENFLKQSGGLGIKQKERPFSTLKTSNETEKNIFIFKHKSLISLIKKAKATLNTRPKHDKLQLNQITQGKPKPNTQTTAQAQNDNYFDDHGLDDDRWRDRWRVNAA